MKTTTPNNLEWIKCEKELPEALTLYIETSYAQIYISKQLYLLVVREEGGSYIPYIETGCLQVFKDKNTGEEESNWIPTHALMNNTDGIIHDKILAWKEGVNKEALSLLLELYPRGI